MAKFYAVKEGKKPGIYHTWDECKEQVNGYSGAVYKSFTNEEEAKAFIKKEERKVVLDLTIDTDIAPVLDYFEIFMDRTMMSKFAAKYLGIWFELVINDTKLL